MALSGKSGAVEIAAGEIAGINTWSLSYDYSTVAVTDFQDDGVTAKISTISEWSGSFSGFKDAAPITLAGAIVAVELKESETAGQTWTGNCILTNLSSEVAFEGAVTYSYTFEGTGVLTIATA